MSAPSQDATPIGAIANRLFGGNADRATRKRWALGDSPRTGQPVWRNSYYVGTIEHKFWRPIGSGSKRDGRRYTGALLKAARKLELESRAQRREVEPGCRNGKLGALGLEVLGVLCELVDFANGRLDPAVGTIAERLGRSYSAVHRALRRLQLAGFLNWIRRSKKREDADSAGPQIEQVSNAYVLEMPGALKSWWDRQFNRGRIPECEKDRAALDRADFQRMLNGMKSEAFIRDFGSRDPLLGPKLADLAAALDRQEERESSTARETGGILHIP